MATNALSAFEASPRAKTAPPASPLPPAVAKPPKSRPQPATRRLGRPNLPARAWVLAVVIALHVVTFAALIAQRHIAQTPPPPLVVELLSIPEAQALPPEAPPITIDVPVVVVTPPVFEIEERLPALAVVVADQPPPMPAPTAPITGVAQTPSTAVAQTPSTVSGGDLSASMIEAVPPKYPYESRRLKEQGTVVLDVLLSPSGMVEQVGVRSSSGFSRLDKAALEAVRRWRWSPTVRNGLPVAVRGLVEIPFALKPRS